MADVRRLDGTVVDTSKLARDDRIASMLAEVVDENEAGRLSAVIVVYVTREGTSATNWILPLEDFGFPWGLAVRGALVAAQHSIGNATIPAGRLPESTA